VELALMTQPFPDSTKAQIRKDMDAGAEAVRAAAKDAGKDGEVTAKEAEAVKNLAFKILAEARGKYLKPAPQPKAG
jgi:phosphosulfolactate synthase (CoM biosynthesis protein A)